MFKVFLHMVGSLYQCSHKRFGLVFQVFHRFSLCPGVNSVLQVIIQVFIGIEFGRV